MESSMHNKRIKYHKKSTKEQNSPVHSYGNKRYSNNDVQTTIINDDSNGKKIDTKEYLSTSENLLEVLRSTHAYFSSSIPNLNSSLNQSKIANEISTIKSEIVSQKKYYSKLKSKLNSQPDYELIESSNSVDNFIEILIDTIDKLNKENTELSYELKNAECEMNNQNEYYNEIKHFLKNEISRMKGIMKNISKTSNSRTLSGNYISQKEEINRIKFDESFNITNTSNSSNEEVSINVSNVNRKDMAYGPRRYAQGYGQGVTKTTESGGGGLNQSKNEKLISSAIMGNGINKKLNYSSRLKGTRFKNGKIFKG